MSSVGRWVGYRPGLSRVAVTAVSICRRFPFFKYHKVLLLTLSKTPHSQAATPLQLHTKVLGAVPRLLNTFANILQRYSNNEDSFQQKYFLLI